MKYSTREVHQSYAWLTYSSQGSCGSGHPQRFCSPHLSRSPRWRVTEWHLCTSAQHTGELRCLWCLTVGKWVVCPPFFKTIQRHFWDEWVKFTRTAWLGLLSGILLVHSFGCTERAPATRPLPMTLFIQIPSCYSVKFCYFCIKLFKYLRFLKYVYTIIFKLIF